MRLLGLIATIFISTSAFSYEVSVSCSTASYRCEGSLCAWWMDSVPIDQRPTKVTLTQDSQDANAWKVETTQKIKNFLVTSKIYATISKENEFKFINSVELSKDGITAEAPGFTSPYGHHLSIRLRTNDASLDYTCLIKPVK